MIQSALIYIAASAAGIYALWVFYLAVMNLSRAKRDGTLKRTAYVLGVPVLIAGLVIDFLVNVFVMTVVLLEIPREITVTARLTRDNMSSTGYRKSVAAWFVPLLDPFDPSGDHI